MIVQQNHFIFLARQGLNYNPNTPDVQNTPHMLPIRRGVDLATTPNRESFSRCVMGYALLFVPEYETTGHQNYVAATTGQQSTIIIVCRIYIVRIYPYLAAGGERNTQQTNSVV